jgi:hypothetical protein
MRIAAGLSLALGITVLMAFLHLLGKGPFASLEMRHLRDMKDRTDVPSAPTEYSFEDFRRLPHRLSVAEYSGLERQAVVLEGYVQHMLRAPDGDTHLEIVPYSDSLPAAYVTAEITPGFVRSSGQWRFERLAAALRPARGTRTPWSGGPRRTRMSGWLLYDFQHDDSLGHGRGDGVPRMTGWEIHPVTAIELWDDSLGRFVEYAR